MYDYAAHHPAAEVISWENPRAVVFRSFLSPDEVEHFINVSASRLTRSEVLSDASAVDQARTSFGTWPPRDDVISAVEDRIHRLVGVPQRFGEEIYVLNYKLSQKYDAGVAAGAAAAAGGARDASQRALQQLLSSSSASFLGERDLVCGLQADGLPSACRPRSHNDHCMDDNKLQKVADGPCKEFLARAGGPECGPGKGGPSCGDRVATFIMTFK